MSPGSVHIYIAGRRDDQIGVMYDTVGGFDSVVDDPPIGVVIRLVDDRLSAVRNELELMRLLAR